MKPILAILILAVFVTGAAAQLARDYTGVVSYEISVPTGNTAEYGVNTSFRGFGFQGRRFLNPRMSWGFSWDWSTFNGQSEELISVGNMDISGHQHRIMYSMPILANFHYYFGDVHRVQESAVPFVGIGAGTYWIKPVLEIGVLAFEDSNWHFGFAPEVGILIPVSYYSDLFLSTKYNYAFESGDAEAQSYWTIFLGIAYAR